MKIYQVTGTEVGSTWSGGDEWSEGYFLNEPEAIRHQQILTDKLSKQEKMVVSYKVKETEVKE